MRPAWAALAEEPGAGARWRQGWTLVTPDLRSVTGRIALSVLDPELLELFIEEAKEEIATIKRDLPAWASAPSCSSST